MPRYIVRDYYDCQRCPLAKFRRNIVFGRGTLPADLLFCGEAPGKSEDMIGIPFIGPSGRLLNAALERASSLSGLSAPSYFVTNICGCRPTDSLKGDNRPPSPEESWACFGRLERTYNDVSPKVVVLLGDIARKYGLKSWPSAVCLPHPAAILRAGGESSPMFRMFCRNLSEVFKTLAVAHPT